MMSENLNSLNLKSSEPLFLVFLSAEKLFLLQAFKHIIMQSSNVISGTQTWKALIKHLWLKKSVVSSCLLVLPTWCFVRPPIQKGTFHLSYKSLLLCLTWDCWSVAPPPPTPPSLVAMVSELGFWLDISAILCSICSSRSRMDILNWVSTGMNGGHMELLALATCLLYSSRRIWCFSQSYLKQL